MQILQQPQSTRDDIKIIITEIISMKHIGMLGLRRRSYRFQPIEIKTTLTETSTPRGRNSWRKHVAKPSIPACVAPTKLIILNKKNVLFIKNQLFL